MRSSSENVPGVFLLVFIVVFVGVWWDDGQTVCAQWPNEKEVSDSRSMARDVQSTARDMRRLFAAPTWLGVLAGFSDGMKNEGLNKS